MVRLRRHRVVQKGSFMQVILEWAEYEALKRAADKAEMETLAKLREKLANSWPDTNMIDQLHVALQYRGRDHVRAIFNQWFEEALK
jgi:hypothetical protein